MQNQDVRWLQRFANFEKALTQLRDAVELAQSRKLSHLEQQGLIQAFEYTHELAWNTLKDFLSYQGVADIIGSRDATRLAFKNNLIEDGDAWMDMIQSRNLTSHTYNISTANLIADKIIASYCEQFIKLSTKLAKLAS